MKRYKYQTLTKNEKKETINKFYETPRGKELKLRLNRLLMYSCILLIFGLYLLIDAIINKDSIAQIIYAAITILFGVVFLIGRYIVRLKNVNEYIVKKK